MKRLGLFVPIQEGKEYYGDPAHVESAKDAVKIEVGASYDQNEEAENTNCLSKDRLKLKCYKGHQTPNH